MIQDDSTSFWEVFLVDQNNYRIPMEHLGSGIKTVLLVLLNVIVLPVIEKVPLQSCVFGFEELENNLHPAAQRRLFTYIREKATSDGCVFFVTTHSNVVIDLFASDDVAQILHVTHDGRSAHVQTVETHVQGRDVLADLGVRASDLLQANAIIWVEGPSDRIYLRRWIELWTDGQIREHEHFEIAIMGGSCNKYFDFRQPDDASELIQAIRINGNAIVLMDSDKQCQSDQLKPEPERIRDEVTECNGYAWITSGREIENHIPTDVLKRLFPECPEVTSEFEDIPAMIPSISKPDLAEKIVPELTRDMLEADADLGCQLRTVCARIAGWNDLESENRI